MKNMKKVLGLMLAGAMVVPMVACGSKTADAPADAAPADTAETTDDAAPADEGKVLNIQCWNDEFANRLADHYPGFVKNDEEDVTKGGKIGDVEVKFTIPPSTDNAYQNNLDSVLPGNADAAADDKVDIFLLEADYAKKYINSDVEVTEKISDLGITDADLADQYQYTKDVVTDAKGDLRGVSWQACPGVLIYNREIAKSVLGSDDPAEVQKAVADWDTYNKTAEAMKAAGYSMTVSAVDTYRVFSNNVKKPWVTDGKITIDDNLMKWVEMSKEEVDAGETGTADLWGDEWNAGFKAPGTAFCYFGPAWLINFCMGNTPDNPEDDGSIAHAGGWGATEGPQGFYWGGTWIAAAKGTDNKTLVADIIKQLTCNKDIMTDIVKKDSDFVNNKPAMEAAAKDDSYAFAVLGGQNPLQMFCNGCASIDLSNMGDYDQGCNEEFQNAMKAYFDGSSSEEDALNAFYTAVETKYPELSH